MSEESDVERAMRVMEMVEDCAESEWEDEHFLGRAVLAITAERDSARRERDEAREQLKFTHPVFNNASKGPVEVEPESSLPGFDPNVYRIVREEDARRFRDDYQTTARPPYLATVYSHDDALLCAFAFNEFENTLRAMRKATSEADSLRTTVASLRAALVEACDLASTGMRVQDRFDDSAEQARIAELRRLAEAGE